MVAFHYRTRSVEEWEKRANQSGGDFESWIKDEYRNFRPKKGENCVRLLPPSPKWPDANHYGIDVWVHFGIGPERGSVICLFKQSQKPCPICEERARAESARDEDLVKELKPTRRVLAFVLDRKDEGQGALAWGMPYTVDRDVSKASKNRETGEYYFVDHPEQGYDVYFDREGEGLGTKYNGVGLARHASRVPARILDWLKDNPVPDALRWRDYDEVKRLYEGVGRGEDPADRRARGNGHDDGGRGRRPERPPLRTPGSDRRSSEREPPSRDYPDSEDYERPQRSSEREPPPRDYPDDPEEQDQPQRERRPPPEREPEPQEVRRPVLERPGARLSRPGGSAAPADDLTRAVPREAVRAAADADRPPFDTDERRPSPVTRPADGPAGDGKGRAAQLRAKFALQH